MHALICHNVGISGKAIFRSVTLSDQLTDIGSARLHCTCNPVQSLAQLLLRQT